MNEDRIESAAPAEDYRVTHARKALAESKAAEMTAASCPSWWGTLESTVEALLAVIDEQGHGGVINRMADGFQRLARTHREVAEVQDVRLSAIETGVRELNEALVAIAETARGQIRRTQ